MISSERRAVDEAGAWAIIRALQEQLAQLPVFDFRPTDEITGCDESRSFR